MGLFKSTQLFYDVSGYADGVASSLMSTLRYDGYEVDGVKLPSGEWDISIKKGNLFKAVLGLLYNAEDTPVEKNTLNNRFTDDNGFYKDKQLYDEGNIFVIEESESRSFDPKRDYLYPIPSYEIGTSGGNIKQNPYWSNDK